jgi:hypothetical protein
MRDKKNDTDPLSFNSSIESTLNPLAPNNCGFLYVEVSMFTLLIFEIALLLSPKYRELLASPSCLRKMWGCCC